VGNCHGSGGAVDGSTLTEAIGGILNVLADPARRVRARFQARCKIIAAQTCFMSDNWYTKGIKLRRLSRQKEQNTCLIQTTSPSLRVPNTRTD
jgi:hypothetical protein